MRLTTTILMLVLAVALAAAIIGIERFLPSTREAESKRLNPISFPANEADRIELQIKESRIVLAKEKGIWRVEQPFQDFADPDLASRLLASLGSIEWLQALIRDDFDQASWEKTGLDAPAASAKVLSQGRVAAEASFGNASAIEGAVCLSIAEKDGRRHHLGRTDLPQLFQKPVEEWRDPRLLRVQPESVSRIVLAAAGGQIEAVRDTPRADWRLVKPLQTLGNTARIDDLLGVLLGLKITAAAAGKKGGDTTAAASPAADELAVTLEVAGFGPLTATLVKPAANSAATTATVSHRASVFTVTSEQLASLWAQPNDLRFDKLARINPDAVTEVRIESLAHAPVVLAKQADAWMLQRHGQMEPANGERLSVLFEALATHRIREFASDSASNLEAFGLAKPFLTVSWLLAGGKPGKILFGTDGKESVFAKHESEPFVYRIAPAVLNAFPSDGVKWKGLTPLRFSIFALHRITLSMGTAPSWALAYNPDTAGWSGSVAGRDITASIDRVAADRLADSLASLTVQDWAQDRTDGILALREPEITVRIDLGEPGNAAGPVKQRVLHFSPTQKGAQTAIYFGQLDNGPDVFFITRERLREVLQPVLKRDG